MNAWTCATYISISGAFGGLVNALLTDNGFILPRRIRDVVCPGFLTNVLIGAFAAFASWAMYGSGAGIDIAKEAAKAAGEKRTEISLTFSALAGAFIVGVAGARWITNEVDKRLLKESVKIAGDKHIDREECDQIVRKSPRRVLEAMARA